MKDINAMQIVLSTEIRRIRSRRSNPAQANAIARLAQVKVAGVKTQLGAMKMYNCKPLIPFLGFNPKGEKVK